MAGYSLYVVDLVGQEFRVENPETVKSNYIIQNLQGDTIDTWLSWRLVDGATLHVNVINSEQYPEKLGHIRDVILSEESIEIDDSLLHKGPKGSTSTYYLGWAGALSAASEEPSELYIPTDLEVIESASGEGQITIHLTDDASGDGFSGYTKSIADDSQNQILKSDITIYEVDKLNDEQFKTILRHEFGHALGLAHSTAPEDLMAPQVTTEYPYISGCDVSAIHALYDGSKSSQVVCEK
ncbi:MAG: matrixin family metalloprotease [Nitrosopumilaceae archaeon]|nr:matrixin family metalloprotease [Nitrosopumilaceae archaeon]NIU02337.1 matrixin family metalloprotease [Nitrosopumilaceae archaeon]NIU88792.1 matrixin family metalloprotease [Nitrosopumilaceae archaeon]NIV66919.1 matrixin family metalloprotease [Nitrosopumilaceae archaeon]NIX62938.1 matrixin family metalloprotease [Nitrosopumilaceae archaeon]